jgi:hypothetical protein
MRRVVAAALAVWLWAAGSATAQTVELPLVGGPAPPNCGYQRALCRAAARRVAALGDIDGRNIRLEHAGRDQKKRMLRIVADYESQAGEALA